MTKKHDQENMIKKDHLIFLDHVTNWKYYLSKTYGNKSSWETSTHKFMWPFKHFFVRGHVTNKYLHYHHAYDHKTYQGGDILQEAYTHKFAWFLKGGHVRSRDKLNTLYLHL